LRLNESEASIDEVEWSADGSRLMRQSLDGGIAAPLYRAPAEALLRGLTVSPDGRHLAFRTMDPEAGVAVIHVLPVAGGTARELLRLAKGETIPGSSPGSSIVWTPQSDAVLFVKRIGTASDARNHVWRVPLTTRRPEPIGVSMAGLANIRLRSDARALAFVAGERSADVWVMENFLPPPATPSSTGRAKGPR
jgi:hypothetical protein